MVQMGDNVAVERCVQNLNNVAVGLTGAAPLTLNAKNKDVQNDNVKEHKLQLAFSKQPFLSEVTNPYPLPDKSPSYKLYINNKNNRFMNPAMASKNRIQPPSKVSENVQFMFLTILLTIIKLFIKVAFLAKSKAAILVHRFRLPLRVSDFLIHSSTCLFHFLGRFV